MSKNHNQAAQTNREAFEQWYIENCPDMAAEPIGSRLFALQWSAHTAGREQGLREAKEACQRIKATDGSNSQAWECAAAIEQLTKPAGA